MSRLRRMSPRRSYDQYCSAARALDAVGDRWTLLIVRELLAGPRRYTDLHADLPGVSTDVLASRLKDMERDGLSTRRRLPARSGLRLRTHRPRTAVAARAAGAGGVGPVRTGRAPPTDAVRAHWFALPLLSSLEGEGLLEVHLEEGDFHLYAGAEDGPVYGEGPAPREPDARLDLDFATCEALARGEMSLADAVRDGRATVTGEGTLAKALLEA